MSSEWRHDVLLPSCYLIANSWCMSSRFKPLLLYTIDDIAHYALVGHVDMYKNLDSDSTVS